MKTSILTIAVLFIVMAAGHAFGQVQGGGCPAPLECKPTDGGKNPTAGKGVRIGKLIFKAIVSDDDGSLSNGFFADTGGKKDSREQILQSTEKGPGKDLTKVIKKGKKETKDTRSTANYHDDRVVALGGAVNGNDDKKGATADKGGKKGRKGDTKPKDSPGWWERVYPFTFVEMQDTGGDKDKAASSGKKASKSKKEKHAMLTQDSVDFGNAGHNSSTGSKRAGAATNRPAGTATTPKKPLASALSEKQTGQRSVAYGLFAMQDKSGDKDEKKSKPVEKDKKKKKETINIPIFDMLTGQEDLVAATRKPAKGSKGVAMMQTDQGRVRDGGCVRNPFSPKQLGKKVKTPVQRPSWDTISG